VVLEVEEPRRSWAKQAGMLLEVGEGAWGVMLDVVEEA
jgi:hypothetical protein